MSFLFVLLSKINGLFAAVFAGITPSLFKDIVELLEDSIHSRFFNQPLKQSDNHQFSRRLGSSGRGGRKKSKKKEKTPSLWDEVRQIRFRSLVGLAVMFTIGATSIVFIYQNSTKIIMGISSPSPPLSPEVQEEENTLKPRPSYVGLERKHGYIASLHIPVYFHKNKKRIRAMQVEFIFETSNRYIKKYLKNHEYEVRDRILTNLEPVDPQFIFTEEGQDIIKFKVLDEINEVVRSKKIRGQIERVSIHHIIAS